MRSIFYAALSIAAAQAIAQPTGADILPPTGPKPQEPVPGPQTAQSLDCVPKTMLTPLGGGTQLRSGVGPGGSWWGTWCPGAAAPYVHIVLNGYEWTSNRIGTTMAVLLSDANPLEAIRFALMINAVPHQAADQTTWDAITAEAVAAMAADNPASAPPVYTHFVKPNTASTTVPATRPAYTLVDGVRATKEVGRAVVDQPCNTGRPTLAAGSDMWAEFGPAFAPGVVALCAKRQ